MKDQFVTYELAKKLKELGFNEPCFKYYGISSKALFDMAKGKETVNNEQFKNDPEDVWCSAPLWQQAIDWLRAKGIHITIQPIIGAKIKSTGSTFLKNSIDADFIVTNEWEISFENCKPNTPEKTFNGFCKSTYEQAREAAILKTLELIK